MAEFLQTIVETTRRRTGHMRAVLRILESLEFERVYNKAPEHMKGECERFTNPDQVRRWMANAVNAPLMALSFQQLRSLCVLNQVFNYSRLTKEEMAAALRSKGINDARQLDKDQNADRRDAAPAPASGCPSEADGNAVAGPELVQAGTV